MQKTYVLDTNVLIQAPYALESFEENHIVLPLAVLEELDRMKQSEGERGQNARQVIRRLDTLRAKGSLFNGVPLDNANGKRPTTLYINDMSKFPIYALDFGTGQPSSVEPPDLPDPIRLWPAPSADAQPILYFGGHMAKRYNRLRTNL